MNLGTKAAGPLSWRKAPKQKANIGRVIYLPPSRTPPICAVPRILVWQEPANLCDLLPRRTAARSCGPFSKKENTWKSTSRTTAATDIEPMMATHPLTASSSSLSTLSKGFGQQPQKHHPRSAGDSRPIASICYVLPAWDITKLLMESLTTEHNGSCREPLPISPRGVHVLVLAYTGTGYGIVHDILF